MANYIPGEWNAICDQCGRKYKASKLRKRWDGFMVCDDDWETRHPQDFVKPIKDNEPLPWTRVEPTDGAVDVSYQNHQWLETYKLTTANASTPDSASLDITGDIEIRVKVAPKNWVPVDNQTIMAKWNQPPNQRAYGLNLLTSGLLELAWSTAGSDTIVKQSTIKPSTLGQKTLWIKVTLDVDNGLSENVVTFYTSVDGSTWAILGSPVVTSGTTSIFSSSSDLYISGHNNGATYPYNGKVYNVEIYNGIGGTLVGSFDANDVAAGSTDGDTFVSSDTGETWTINGTAIIKNLLPSAAPEGTFNLDL